MREYASNADGGTTQVAKGSKHTHGGGFVWTRVPLESAPVFGRSSFGMPQPVKLVRIFISLQID